MNGASLRSSSHNQCVVLLRGSPCASCLRANALPSSESSSSSFLSTSGERDQSLDDVLHLFLGKPRFTSPYSSLCDYIRLTPKILNRHPQRVLDARGFKAELEAARKQSNQPRVDLVELFSNDLELCAELLFIQRHFSSHSQNASPSTTHRT